MTAERAAPGSRPGRVRLPRPFRVPPAVRAGAARAARRARRLLRRLVLPWRRSLYLRVMTITVLLGMLVSFALGSFIYRLVTNALAEDKVTRSLTDAAQAADLVAGQFADLADPDETALTQAAGDAVQAVTQPDGQRMAVLAPPRSGERFIQLSLSSGLANDAVPVGLVRAVEADPGTFYSQVGLLRYANGDRVAAVFVSARVPLGPAGPNDLTLVYPMRQVEQTRAIVADNLWRGGALLVVVLGGLAFMVTRLVVIPVRSARHVAERLTSGALNERMPVRGDDDLARLATSFNAMADSLQAQIRQLEELSVVQQRFTSDVSHELRTPLTTIRMAADLLYSGREDFRPPVARSVELLSKELDRFESLLADLLEISRFDAGAAALEVDEVDLREVVNRVVEAQEVLAERVGTRVEVQAPLPCVAQMDARRIERVVRNLVTNAIEHSEGRPVEIAVGAAETAVAVAVRDHGVGLGPGEASMVFERFWRADPARARTTGGTGLGLAIALEDAHLHDGWLQAWGEPGAGSCFRLTLPRTRGVPIKRAPVPLVPVEPEPVAGPAAVR